MKETAYEDDRVRKQKKLSYEAFTKVMEFKIIHLENEIAKTARA